MVKVEKVHSGQYRRYGDSYEVWNIYTVDEKEAMKCARTLVKNMPDESSVWHKNIMCGGEKHGDADYYFNGYYTLSMNDVGYEFKVCYPYDD